MHRKGKMESDPPSREDLRGALENAARTIEQSRELHAQFRVDRAERVERRLIEEHRRALLRLSR